MAVTVDADGAITITADSSTGKSVTIRTTDEETVEQLRGRIDALQASMDTPDPTPPEIVTDPGNALVALTQATGGSLTYIGGDLTTSNTSGSANAPGETVTITDPFGNGTDIVVTAGTPIKQDGTELTFTWLVSRSGTSLRVRLDPETNLAVGESVVLPITLDFSAPTTTRIRARDVDRNGHSYERLLVDNQPGIVSVTDNTRIVEVATPTAGHTAGFPTVARVFEASATSSGTDVRGMIDLAYALETQINLAVEFERRTVSNTAASVFFDFEAELPTGSTWVTI